MRKDSEEVMAVGDGLRMVGMLMPVRMTVLWMAVVAGAVAPEPVDVNRATVVELMRVNGMTASWAARIVRFRPYRTKLDLLERGVVSQEVYQRIRGAVVAHRVVTAEKDSKGKGHLAGEDAY